MPDQKHRYVAQKVAMESEGPWWNEDGSVVGLRETVEYGATLLAEGERAGLEKARDASCEQCRLGIPLHRRYPIASNYHDRSPRYHGLRNCSCPGGILDLLGVPLESGKEVSI